MKLFQKRTLAVLVLVMWGKLKVPYQYIFYKFIGPTKIPIQVLNVPFVLGTSPSLPATLLVACLMATARALNADSAL
jgi:hypothetical protein